MPVAYKWSDTNGNIEAMLQELFEQKMGYTLDLTIPLQKKFQIHYLMNYAQSKNLPQK